MSEFEADAKPVVHNGIYLYGIKEGDIVEMDYNLKIQDGKFIFVRNNQFIPFRVKRGDVYIQENGSEFSPISTLREIIPGQANVLPDYIHIEEFNNKQQLIDVLNQRINELSLLNNNYQNDVARLTAEQTRLNDENSEIRNNLDNKIREFDTFKTTNSVEKFNELNSKILELNNNINNLNNRIEEKTSENSTLAAQLETAKANANDAEVQRLSLLVTDRETEIENLKSQMNEINSQKNKKEEEFNNLTEQKNQLENEIVDLKRISSLNESLTNKLNEQSSELNLTKQKLEDSLAAIQETQKRAEAAENINAGLKTEVEKTNNELNETKKTIKNINPATYYASIPRQTTDIGERIKNNFKEFKNIYNSLNIDDNSEDLMFGGSDVSVSDQISKMAYKVFFEFKKNVRLAATLINLSAKIDAKQTESGVKEAWMVRAPPSSGETEHPQTTEEKSEYNVLFYRIKDIEPLYSKLHDLQNKSLRLDQIAFFLSKMCDANMRTYLDTDDENANFILEALNIICGKLRDIKTQTKNAEKITGDNTSSGVLSYLRIRSDTANKFRNNPRFNKINYTLIENNKVLKFDYYNTQKQFVPKIEKEKEEKRIKGQVGEEVSDYFDANSGFQLKYIYLDDKKYYLDSSGNVSFPSGKIENINFTFGPFDDIFAHKNNQQIATRFCKPVLEELKNNPVCVIAYGFSGSGKTTTLIKEDYTNALGVRIENPGMVEFLAKESKSNKIYLSAFETSDNSIINMFGDVNNKPPSFEFDQNGENYVCNDMTTIKTWNDPEKMKDMSDKTKSRINELKNEDSITFSDMLELILLLRKTKSTINNDYSSRTHVILSVGLTGYKTLFICDFAGTEQQFDTSKESIKLMGLKPTYREEYLKAENFINDVVSKFDVVQEQHKELLEKYLEYVELSTQTVTDTDIEAILYKLETNLYENLTKYLPTLISYKENFEKKAKSKINTCKEKIKSYNTTKRNYDALLKNSIDNSFKKEGIKNAGKTRIDKITSAENVTGLSDYLTTTVGLKTIPVGTFENESTNYNTVESFYNEIFRRIQTQNDTIEKYDKIITEINSLSVKETNEYKKQLLKKYLNERIGNNISDAFIKSKIRKDINDFYVANIQKIQKTDEQTNMPNFNDLNDSMKSLSNIEDILDKETNIIMSYDKSYNYLMTECKNRNKEGEYINQSLEQLRIFIAKSVLKHNREAYPSFESSCVPIQCSAYYKNCFGKIDYPEKQTDLDRQFEVTCNPSKGNCDIKPNMMQCIYDNFQNKSDFENMKFCIFGTANFGIMANDPPPIPYVYINNLKQVIEELDAANQPIRSKDRIEVLNAKYDNGYVKHVIKILTDLSNNELLNWTPSMPPSTETETDSQGTKPQVPQENPSEVRQKFKEKAHTLINTAIDNMKNNKIILQVKINSLEEVVKHINDTNSVTTIGTLEFIDSITKMGMTETVCATRAESKQSDTNIVSDSEEEDNIEESVSGSEDDDATVVSQSKTPIKPDAKVVSQYKKNDAKGNDSKQTY